MSEPMNLLSTKAIRAQAEALLQLNLQGEGQFYVAMDKLDEVADFVIKTIKEKYPRWNIPYHSRWGHFRVGGRDRVAELAELIVGESTDEKTRILFDLVIASVLLDAGAGPDWKYTDEQGQLFSRSEGLAVASFEMFKRGAFSSEPRVRPLKADASGLMGITAEHIEKAFQVSVGNPLLGVKGRAELMFRLGKIVAFGDEPGLPENLKRPGRLYDLIKERAKGDTIEAHDILSLVLKILGPIWPGRIIMNDVNLGDCWRHDGLGMGPAGFVPFHKLSQWLSYSLLEPLEAAGYKVVNLSDLTGLAEYRNGGLMIDSGLITPKVSGAFDKPWPPDSKLIIEWRALTVALLDRLADRIREKIGKTKEEFPLVKVLEGGTWWAGRKLAQARRNGRPPIDIVSDGTVF